MKKRNSFVSNSSSTSFVVNVNEYNKYNNKLKLYKTKELYEKYGEITAKIEELRKMFPNFISSDLYYTHLPYYEEIKSLYEKNPDCYISDEEDRDWAYNNEIAYQLDTFQNL